MSCAYFYDNILKNYLNDVRTKILINNSYDDKPFPIYESIDDYNNDTESEFKGLLVWLAQRYYAGFENNENNDVYDNSIDFYIVPEIGKVKILRNVEYSQLISYTFDTNTLIPNIACRPNDENASNPGAELKIPFLVLIILDRRGVITHIQSIWLVPIACP